MKKIIRYGLIILVVALVGYKSVYFRKLSDMQKATSTEKFDATVFARKLWNEQLPSKLDSAIELNNLIASIKANPEQAFAQNTKSMAIGNYRYALIKTTGKALIVNEDDVVLQVANGDSLLNLNLATEYVYGNAVRDASGLVNIQDFTNTTDLNNISEALNKTIRTSVLPPFKNTVKAGNQVTVVGAIELNKAHVGFKNLEIIPIRISVQP